MSVSRKFVKELGITDSPRNCLDPELIKHLNGDVRKALILSVYIDDQKEDHLAGKQITSSNIPWSFWYKNYYIHARGVWNNIRDLAKKRFIDITEERASFIRNERPIGLPQITVCVNWDEIQQMEHKIHLHRHGYVYLMKHPHDTYLYKIGHTSKIRTRLKDLKKEYGSELTVIATIPTRDRYRLERMVQEHFADRWVEKEWFYLEEEHVEYFKSLIALSDME